MIIRIVIVVLVLTIEVASYVRLCKCNKKVKPELEAVFRIKGEEFKDYRCECGYGVAEDYRYCPYCGTELNWDNVHK